MPDLMDGPGRWDSIQLLDRARAGDADCLGGLLEIYRSYLHLLASAQLDARLRSRVNPSDLVQETFLRASRHFGEFCGSSEQEWLGWLRTILRRSVLKMLHRQVVARKRSVLREISLQNLAARCGPEASGSASLMVSSGSSPSSHARRQELSARQWPSACRGCQRRLAAKSWCCGIWEGSAFQRLPTAWDARPEPSEFSGCGRSSVCGNSQ